MVAAACLCSAATDYPNWEYRQEITLEKEGPIRLSLPPETLDAAREDLADLRLLGPDGTEIPFAIVQRSTVRPTTQRIPLQARLDDRTTVVEFGLARTQPIQRILLETPAPEFTKAATVEAEAGDDRWSTVVESALVFRLRGGLAQLALDLRGIPARSLRITLDDRRSDPVPLTAVVVETGAADPESWIDLPARIVGTDNDAGTSRVTLDLGFRHRHIAEIELDARERTFQRGVHLVALSVDDNEVVEQELGTGTVARMAFSPEQQCSHLRIPIDAVSPTRELELVVDNGDSPPLSDIRIVAHLRRIDIGFDAPEAGRYTLLSGAPHTGAPRYDVAAFAADWGRLTSTDMPAGPRTANPGFRAEQTPTDVPALAGPIDPAKWSTRRDIRLDSPGAQILELDVPALAAAKRDLGDLRIARGDRQVPYLLERTARTRALPLTLVPTPNKARPNVGRWELALPVANMPLTAVRLTIDATPFSRNAVVGELRSDSRGQPFQKALGYARIERRNAEDPTVFTVPFQERPLGATLVVEIDHGDNAAFAPTAAAVLHPVRRLRFRADETAGLTLLYGNPAAAAPRYDLQLAAPRLLAATQHAAQLTPAEPARTARPVFGLGSTGTKIAFWGALAVAVAVLIRIVMRLLPKPPDAA